MVYNECPCIFLFVFIFYKLIQLKESILIGTGNIGD